MKKLLLFAICTIFYSSYAQLPPNSFAEDFTLTDINGNEFNLHSTLDEGKTIILDLFATWCGPCWNYASLGVLGDLQDTYPNDVVVVAVESDPTTAASTLYSSALGNWTTISDYLMMDDPSGDVADAFMLTGYPTIIKICPDRMATEVGQIQSVSGFMNEINTCSSAQYERDAKILSYDRPSSYCDGNIGSSNIMIQNYSLGAPLTSCNIELRVDNEILYSTTWNGSLETYQTASVNIPAQSGIVDGSEIAFHITYNGDMDTNNNGFWPEIAGSKQSSNNISLSILTDDWPEETTWELKNGNGSTIESGGPYTGQALTEITEEWDLDPGCYTLNVFDSYGDGVEGSIWGNGASNGLVLLTDIGSWNGSITEENIWNGIAFEDQASISFEVMAQFDINESSNVEINVFPNPFKEFTYLSIDHKTNHVHRHMPLGDLNVEIYNNIGKIVYSNQSILTPGINNLKIESGNLLPGLYYMNVIIDGVNNLKPLNIIK
jgi:thiol-disulfide isomerase/thioredoxin